MLLLSLVLSSSAAPNDEWRTIRTEHYDVHYPAAAEEWATAAASRLEAIRERTAEQVGWQLEQRVTVVLRDPYAASNGMALPLLKGPRTELWLTPPGAASPIGWNRRWDEGLIVHEDAHLVHLSRPSRGGIDKILDAIVGIGPIARKSPRWVAEGYATVVEGDQTGFGRPYAAAEMAAVRRLAKDGALPSYDELNGTTRWGGQGFAYGIGAAYLTWLRDKAGEESLRELWVRMSAVESRSFDQAFEGIFGDSPAALYGRWAAETTAAAMALEALRPPRADTRWLDLSEGVGAPAVSPDGTHLAVVVTQDGRPVLSVYETAPDPDAAKDREKAIKALLAVDPLDIPDRPKPEPTLKSPEQRTRRDRAPNGVHWMNDQTLLFASRVPDSDGRLRMDLFSWNVNSKEELRRTRGQDLVEAHPSPDGHTAIAVQQRWGASCLARVNLDTGAVRCLTSTSVDVVYDNPRFDPTGKRLLWLQQNDGPWTLMTATVAQDGLANIRPVPTPAIAQLATPTWHPDGKSIVASLGWDSVMELAQIPLDGGEIRLLSRSHGGAIAPSLTADGMYWLDQDSRGYDVHYAPSPGPTEALPEPVSEPSLAVLPLAPTVPELARAQVTSQPYGLGKTERRFLLEAATGRQEAYLAGVIRLGDVIGRHEALLRAGRVAHPGGNSLGLRATLALRSAPSDVHFDSFVGAADNTWDLFGGGAVSVVDRHRWPTGIIEGDAGFYGIYSPGNKSASAAGHGSVRVRAWEPTARWVSVDASLATTTGDMGPDGLGAWIRHDVDVGLLRDALRLKADLGLAVAQAPDLGLGGVISPFLPAAVQRGVVVEPALPRGTPGGRQYLGLKASLGAPEGALWVQRHRIGETLANSGGFTLVGASSTVSPPAQPLVGLPAFDVTAGVSCLIETPDEGFLSNPLRNLDNWALWTSVLWRL